MRKRQKKRNAKIFVSWHDILQVKRKSEPKDIDSTSKTGVISVPMQKVVDHQIEKILEKPYVRENFNNLIKSGRQFKLTLYGKYGADGTPSEADFQTSDAGENFDKLDALRKICNIVVEGTELDDRLHSAQGQKYLRFC